ncbi:hypothetical protein [Aquitalea palustris]|nr:hypothetical protein [Aquitalea palustris]
MAKMATQFTGQAQVHTDQDYAFNGRTFTDTDYIRLGGAPDGSQVEVTAGDIGVEIAVANPLFETPAVSVIFQSDTGDAVLYLYKDMFVLKPENYRQGIASTSLALQVKHAQALGFAAISLYADGSFSGKLNGYYTWARLGFNMAIPASLLQRLPGTLQHCQDVLDLMETQEGRTWWLHEGFGGDMEFDLTPGSRSDRIFTKYLEEKGIVV